MFDLILWGILCTVLWFTPRRLKLQLKEKISRALTESQVPYYYQTPEERAVERKILTDQR